MKKKFFSTLSALPSRMLPHCTVLYDENIKRVSENCEIWGLHSDRDSSQRCEVVYCYGRIQGEDGGSMVPRNVGILSHYYTVSQPTRSRFESPSP
jgi:hypothetical protein